MGWLFLMLDARFAIARLVSVGVKEMQIQYLRWDVVSY